MRFTISKDTMDNLKYKFFYTFTDRCHYLGLGYPGGWWTVPDEVIFAWLRTGSAR